MNLCHCNQLLFRWLNFSTTCYTNINIMSRTNISTALSKENQMRRLFMIITPADRCIIVVLTIRCYCYNDPWRTNIPSAIAPLQHELCKQQCIRWYVLLLGSCHAFETHQISSYNRRALFKSVANGPNHGYKSANDFMKWINKKKKMFQLKWVSEVRDRLCRRFVRKDSSCVSVFE